MSCERAWIGFEQVGEPDALSARGEFREDQRLEVKELRLLARRKDVLSVMAAVIDRPAQSLKRIVVQGPRDVRVTVAVEYRWGCRSVSVQRACALSRKPRRASQPRSRD